jgi:hypothetical protein
VSLLYLALSRQRRARLMDARSSQDLACPALRRNRHGDWIRLQLRGAPSTTTTAAIASRAAAIWLTATLALFNLGGLKCLAVALRRPRMRFPGRSYFVPWGTQRERTGFLLAGHRHHGRRLTVDPRLARAAATLRSDTLSLDRQVMVIAFRPTTTVVSRERNF